MVGKLVGERGRGNKRERWREEAQKKLKFKLKGKMGEREMKIDSRQRKWLPLSIGKYRWHSCWTKQRKNV